MSCGRARSRDDPLDLVVGSCCKELIHDVTASKSEVSGSSRAAAESRAMMEKRAAGKASRMAVRSCRTPSSLVPPPLSGPPAQSSAAIDPVRSTTR